MPPSWAILGHLGAVLGLSWGHLGLLWGPSWGKLGTSWGYLGAILGLFGGNRGPSWGRLGPSCGQFGPFWAILAKLKAKSSKSPQKYKTLTENACFWAPGQMSQNAQKPTENICFWFYRGIFGQGGYLEASVRHLGPFWSKHRPKWPNDCPI